MIWVELLFSTRGCLRQQNTCDLFWIHMEIVLLDNSNFSRLVLLYKLRWRAWWEQPTVLHAINYFSLIGLLLYFKCGTPFISTVCEPPVSHRQVTAATVLESNSDQTSKPHTCLASQLEKYPLKPRLWLQAHSYKCSQSQPIKIHFFIDAVKFCFCHGTLRRMWPFQECWNSLSRRRQEKDLDGVKATKSTMSCF